MKFIRLTLLIISGITDSRSEQYEVVGPADPVFAVAGEDVILPCSVKPNISVVDLRVEWFRPDLKDSQLVNLYENHEDKNTDQIQSYSGRTELNHQELQRGNASLKLSSVQISDEGRYKCFIQSKSWYDDITVDVRVEAVGSPPVITVDGFDRSGGLHLQCESEGWYPEPDVEWLDSEGISLSSETTETHRNTDRFIVKHTVTVYHSDYKIHCRVKLRHHMLETLIITSKYGKLLQSERRTIENVKLHFQNENTRMQEVTLGLQNEKRRMEKATLHFQKEKKRLKNECFQLLQNQKRTVQTVISHLRKHAVNVTLDADTAHPHLIVFDNGKQVKLGNTKPIEEETTQEEQNTQLKEEEIGDEEQNTQAKDEETGDKEQNTQPKDKEIGDEQNIQPKEDEIRDEEQNTQPKDEIGDEEQNAQPKNEEIRDEKQNVQTKDKKIVDEEQNTQPEEDEIGDEEQNTQSKEDEIGDEEQNTQPKEDEIGDEEQNKQPKDEIGDEEQNVQTKDKKIIEEEQNTQAKDEEIGIEKQNDKFEKYLGVLGKEGFSSGCFYYEVQVKGQTEWDLGVATETVNKKELFSLNPENKCWTVSHRNEMSTAFGSPLDSFFFLSLKLQKIGVFVDYEEGLISFYDVESMSHIHSYTNQSFNEKLYPFFGLGLLWNENSAPLIISPVNSVR